MIIHTETHAGYKVSGWQEREEDGWRIATWLETADALEKCYWVKDGQFYTINLANAASLTEWQRANVGDIDSTITIQTSISFHLGKFRQSMVSGGLMEKVRSRTLATKPQVPLTKMEASSPKSRIDRRVETSEPEMETYCRSNGASGTAAKRNQRDQEWIRRCAVELKKTDGLSSAERFFCAAFSLLFAGKERADLDRAIDRTIDAETSEENLGFSLQHRLRTSGGADRVRTKKYVANYFAAKEKRNREKRFHDAVLFLFHEGFTREELHKFAAQAEET